MEDINLKELFSYYFSKFLIVIFITFISVGLSGLYGMYVQKPKYSSYTTLVLTTTENSNSAITQNDITINQKLVATYREIIKSRRVLNQVIDNLDLDYTVAGLGSRISVTTENNTELIKISVSDGDAKKAKDIANEIAKVFSNEIVDIFSIQNISVIDYAEIAKAPYNINTIKQTAIAVLLGIFISSGIIFLMYCFDTTIKSSEEVEQKIGLPILGLVPKSNHSKKGGNSHAK